MWVRAGLQSWCDTKVLLWVWSLGLLLEERIGQPQCGNPLSSRLRHHVFRVTSAVQAQTFPPQSNEQAGSFSCLSCTPQTKVWEKRHIMCIPQVMREKNKKDKENLDQNKRRWNGEMKKAHKLIETVNLHRQRDDAEAFPKRIACEQTHPGAAGIIPTLGGSRGCRGNRDRQKGERRKTARHEQFLSVMATVMLICGLLCRPSSN